jgi:conjugal transfer pilus assembly protein TraF
LAFAAAAWAQMGAPPEVVQPRASEFYHGAEEGWFWYEDPRPIEEDQPSDPPVAMPEGAAAPAPLSVEWLRTHLPRLRDRAIDSPTRENVQAYYYAQRIMMDRAQVFSDVAQDVVQSDPLLDENLRLPFASAARASLLRESKDAQTAVLKSLATKAGVWVFHDATCAHCASQVSVSNALVKNHGFRVTYLSRQGGPVPGLDASIPVRAEAGRQQRLGITHTPAVVLVVPPSQYVLVTQGALALSELEQRLVSAGHRQGLIDDGAFQRIEPTSRGIVQAHTLTEPSIDWNEPSQWVPYLREAISKTYALSGDVP